MEFITETEELRVDSALSQEIFSIPEDYQKTLEIVNDLVFAKRGKYLSNTEILLLKGALNDLDYAEIAIYSSYSQNYLQRTIATQLWDLLSETIGDGEKVTKKRLCYFFGQLSKKYHIKSTSALEQPLPTKFLGIMPSTTTFYGREKELAHLQELLPHERCISILGVAGIGKTTLVEKLVEHLKGFDQVVWKTFNHAPLLQDLVKELIKLVSNSEPQNLPEYTQALISLLIKHLQSNRYLLVLDSFDYLFARNDLYHKLEYATFIRRLIEEEHQSSLILTSRNWPDELDDILTSKKIIYSFKLKGLDLESAKNFLTEKGVKCTEKSEQLIKTYFGNPSELEAAVNRIYHFFGDQEKFFENPTTLISSKFEAMLNDLFGSKLSIIQKKILIYLAESIVTGTSVTFTTLLDYLNCNKTESISTLEIIKGLEKLERLSLIESIKDIITKEVSFTLQPVIKKYITTDPLGLVHSSGS
ncbi:hypothetical protein NIES2111_64510 (plasmid) [Nostoc sp. NIES-2111]|nr:hypothetical protein NIES2111_64510 [Nostoc sp. NIES-2111]